MAESTLQLTFVVPTLNEGKHLLPLVKQLTELAAANLGAWEIIVVDDGSSDDSAEALKGEALEGVTILRHHQPQGYGASVKKGISQARYPWFALIDADGSYPPEAFPDMFTLCTDNDMVIGARVGVIRKIPWLRRPAKWFINRFAAYVARARIPDVNSGMRICKTEWAKKFWRLLPEGFSLTTTLTIAMIKAGARVSFHTIDYRKRLGRSKIRPLRDFINFIMTVLRLSMAFEPLRVVLPLFFTSTFLALGSLARDIYFRNLADTTLFLFLFSLLILMIGLLADLINRKLPW